MEPANEKNNYSHIAHKLKHLHIKFEDSSGILCYNGILLLNNLSVLQLFLVLLMKLKMDSQSTFGILYTTNAIQVTGGLGH